MQFVSKNPVLRVDTVLLLDFSFLNAAILFLALTRLHRFFPLAVESCPYLLCADFKNVSIVAHYIKDRTKNAQFVIISLRNNMFELADRLVGIYKTDNTTKSVAINPGEFAVGKPSSTNFKIGLAAA